MRLYKRLPFYPMLSCLNWTSRQHLFRIVANRIKKTNCWKCFTWVRWCLVVVFASLLVFTLTKNMLLHTDAEQAIRNLITGSSSPISFQVRKARNQQHQSVGFAERGVRRLRETLSVLLADLNQNGWDIRFDQDEALNYLALMQNYFGRTRKN